MKKRLIFESLMKSLFDIPRVNSSDSLRSVLDKVTASLKAMEGLSATAEQIGFGILTQFVLSKVDNATLYKWEEFSFSKGDELPSWKELEEFLEERANMQESRAFLNSNRAKDSHNQPKSPPIQSAKKSYATISRSCAFCFGSCRNLTQCTGFQEESPHSRYEWVKANHVCVQCLERLPHTVKCSGKKCEACNQSNKSGRHHSLLHFDETNRQQTKLNLNANLAGPTDSVQVLGTAVVHFKSQSGVWIPARILVDSGSMPNFITRKLASKLELPLTKTSTPIIGLFGGQEIKDLAEVSLKSLHGNYMESLMAYVLPEFDHLHPSVKLDPTKLNIPSNLPLADPSFDTPQRVDGIIGVSIAFKMLMVGQLVLTDSLVLQKTRLGWLIAGELNSVNPPPNKLAFISVPNASQDNQLDMLLQRFWDLENVPRPPCNWSPDEQFCENHFVENTTRDEAGRFIVKLPFKVDPSALGNSFHLAKSRLLAVEKKLAADESLRAQYTDFLDEYQRLGHMKRAEEPLGSLNYLPHHCVLKPDSTSTSCRVVFDGSCKTASKLSLNDLMPPGPTIQPTLFDILLRFRFHPVAFACDAVKMYRQFLVHPDDQRYQAILWRQDGEIVHYKLQTVTYGTSSAPFLAVRCVTELSSVENDLPLAQEAAKHDMYIDNMLSGAEDDELAIAMYNQITELFSRGGIQMKKWASNSAHVLSVIPSDDLDGTKQFGDDEVITTLGLNWSPSFDSFMFRIQSPPDGLKWNKRRIVSHTAKIFDPLGFLGPVVAKLKIFAQQLWCLKLSWDESLPQSVDTAWQKMVADLPKLEQIRISRFVFYKRNRVVSTQLHGFADASTTAYGTVFYIRSLLDTGEVIINILCSRSRVAPLKKITLPRLELCGALLLSEMYELIWPTLRSRVNDVYCWLDAQVALAWVTNSPHKYEDFIACRTTKIQERTPNCKWMHVPGELNTSDRVSRGMTADELINYSEWFTGPAFLHKPEAEWIFKPPKELDDNDERLELKKATFALYTNLQVDLVKEYRYHGDLIRTQKFFGHIARIINSIGNDRPSSLKLTPTDLERGLLLAVRIAQQNSLPTEYQLLKDGKEIPLKSSLINLAPFMDSAHVIRVGGRLEYAPDLTYDEKHPILLPKNHPLSFTIMYHHHWQHLHPGQQQLLAMVRRKFWPLGGAALANRVVKNCARCTIAARRVFKQVMANLPENRVSPFMKCFEVVGVDLFGPFQVRLKGRGSKRITLHVAVFICFATRAIQLHYVMGEDTEAFLNTLIRFVSRAGRPIEIWSDNAPNFQSAGNIFAHVDWTKVDEWCRNSYRTSWKHIPARSPHFGGLWESNVKLAKKHLVRVMRNTVLHIDAFLTLLSMVESIVNSRPITPLSINPQDGQPLTPGHFMVGSPLLTLPDPTNLPLPTAKMNYVKTWQHLTEIKNHWLKRWQVEVRQSLQTRQKWHTASKNIRLGKVVLMTDKDESPYAWTAATITKLFPGRDGRVRAVEVTKNTKTDGAAMPKVYRRAITELVPIPMDDDIEEDKVQRRK